MNLMESFNEAWASTLITVNNAKSGLQNTVNAAKNELNKEEVQSKIQAIGLGALFLYTVGMFPVIAGAGSALLTHSALNSATTNNYIPKPKSSTLSKLSMGLGVGALYITGLPFTIASIGATIGTIYFLNSKLGNTMMQRFDNELNVRNMTNQALCFAAGLGIGTHLGKK